MKAFHVYILVIIGIGVTASMLAMNSVTLMMNASIIGLGVWGSYVLIKRVRKGKLRKQTVNLGEGKAFLLTPKKNTAI